MFFNNQKTEELGDMFNMARIGANIMKARKAKGLTQMALADAMGISFQAVGSRLNRARRKLRSAMEGSENDEPA